MDTGAEQRFWAKVEKTDDCWLWTASGDQYGQFWYQGRYRGAHVISYEHVHGPVPLGHQVDHLCRVKRCVNPGHLEAVPAAVNTLRHHRRQTHCGNGHQLSGDNLYLYGPKKTRRGCRTCRKDAQLRYEEKRKAIRNGLTSL